ncbi:MAG: fatty acid desaturase [Armatimonadetes bacterium]|nr:fatty acid desaturase [Armatimonadota bacterium]
MSATIPPSPPKAKAERKVPNYRQQLKKVLPPEYLEPEYGNLAWFLVHFAIIGAGFYALHNYFSYWMALPVALVIGHSFACMGFLGHDVCHGGAVKNIALRDLLAGVAFSPLWIGPYLWRRWHNGEHHGNTQVEGVDPDHLFTIEHYRNSAILRFLYFIPPIFRNLIIFSSFSYRMTQQSMRMWGTYMLSPKSTAHEKWTLFWQWLLPLAFWVTVSSMLGVNVFVWGYFVPLLVGNAIAISYIVTNHFLNPLDEPDEADPLSHSLSVTLPKWLSFLDPWHQYFGAHVAHHMFPMAPAKHARQIEAKIAELWPDRYHVMPIMTALKLLWQTPWVYEDKTTLLDPNRQERAGTLGHGLDVPKK